MKKLILLFALSFFMLTSVYSQEESQGLKGASWGLAAFSFTDNETTQNFTVLPAYGTFISSDVTIGLAAGLSSTKEGDGDASTIYVVKPLLRKYFSATPTFYIFAEPNIPLIFGNDFKAYGFNVDFGIDYFIGGKWTIEAKFARFGYNIHAPDEGASTGTTSLGFNMFDRQTQEGLGGGMSFGLKYLL